jgi:hypothetical protein
MLQNYIDKIKKYQENSEEVNVLALARHLNFNVQSKKLEPTCVGKVFFRDIEDKESPKKNIFINKTLTVKEKNTVLALLISEFIIKYDKILNKEVVEIDIFSFKEIRRNRFSRSIQLATRLIIPENILFQFDDLTNDRELYANKINVNFDFINCAVKDNSLEFLITNEMIWNNKINNF